MSLDFNRVEIGGRLTADIEPKQTTTGRSVIHFTVAVNRPKAANGERTADFIQCVAWDKTAEFISKYFGKGNSIFICGSLRTNKYTDGVGRLVISSEINVTEAYFVDNKQAPQPKDVKAPKTDEDIPF